MIGTPGGARTGRRARILETGWLALRMAAWRAALPVAKHLLPLPTLVRAAVRRPQCGVRCPDRERRVVSLARRVCEVGSGTAATCLERSLITFRFLSEIGARPTLIVGFKRQAGAVGGHVWVEVDGQVVGEDPPQSYGFTPLTVFSSEGVPGA